MPYATQQNLIDRFGEPEILALSDRAGAGSIDAAVVAACLSDADATINSYLGRRHRLPLTDVPERLVRVACDLARRYLYTERPTDDVLAAEKRALDWLRDLSTGAAVLDVATVDQPAATGVVLVEDRPAMFRDHRNRIGGW